MKKFSQKKTMVRKRWFDQGRISLLPEVEALKAEVERLNAKLEQVREYGINAEADAAEDRDRWKCIALRARHQLKKVAHQLKMRLQRTEAENSAIATVDKFIATFPAEEKPITVVSCICLPTSQPRADCPFHRKRMVYSEP